MRAGPPTCAALAALAVTLGGCGGTSGAGRGATAGATLTRAQIVAYAARVNLHQADVPGAVTVAGEGESRFEDPLAAGAEVLRCAQLRRPAAARAQASGTYRAGSQVISVQGGGFITSTVLAAPGGSAAATHAAQERLAAFAGSRWTACLRRYGSVPFFSAHPEAAFTATALRLAGLHGVLARRISYSYERPETAYLPSAEGTEVRAVHRIHRIVRYADVIAFLARRALVEVEATSLGSPPSAAMERAAVGLVRSRAGAGL